MMLTKRWSKLRQHAEQGRLWKSRARFRLVPAGRRSGKTELAKRYTVKCALAATWADAWFVLAAPTRDQAKRIYWRDIKAMVPAWAIVSISETELSVRLTNGALISVVGMDKPQRIEGPPLDGIVLDEYGNMKAEVWGENVRPALSTLGREGWAWLIGVPEGRNHYYQLTLSAVNSEDMDIFTWPSSDILPAAEIEAARGELDERTFKQEYEASFETYTGVAYYCFDRATHIRAFDYDPNAELILAFDFNVEPGIAAIMQEKPEGTAILDEVYIEMNSNTPAVCAKILKDWGHHRGGCLIYGDATGGARGTTQVVGSDWDIIRSDLRSMNPKMRVPKSNPREKVRVNAMNARLLTADGRARLFVHPRCIHIIEDYEGVIVLKGGSGEIDKKATPTLTHLTDAIGYYIVRLSAHGVMHTQMIG